MSSNPDECWYECEQALAKAEHRVEELERSLDTTTDAYRKATDEWREQAQVDRQALENAEARVRWLEQRIETKGKLIECLKAEQLAKVEELERLERDKATLAEQGAAHARRVWELENELARRYEETQRLLNHEPCNEWRKRVAAARELAASMVPASLDGASYDLVIEWRAGLLAALR